jgi:hypothetical protein
LGGGQRIARASAIDDDPTFFTAGCFHRVLLGGGWVVGHDGAGFDPRGDGGDVGVG